MRIQMDCKVSEQQNHQQHQQLHQQQQRQQQQQQQQSANKVYARKLQMSQQQQQPQLQESSDDDDLSTTERKNLEFAQKLGYSDQSIHTVLTRLGSEAKQNELLAELIKLTADAPRQPLPTNSNNSSSNNCVPISNNGNGSLRHIVIDGSNVALSHGNNTVFSCRGIRICVDWFRQRGHRNITAFVPSWRKELANNNIADRELLHELEHERVLVYTPSRHLDGKRVSCYDDRFILKLAVQTDGIVVSNDNYRDLLLESNDFMKVIQERLLMYTFVDDIFMPPDDPLGRSGPTLDMFLQQTPSDAQQQLCPYGKKCTYGQKCKYRHQTALLPLQRLPLQVSHSAPLHSNGGQQLVANNSGGSSNSSNATKLAALARTKSNTIDKISQQQQNQQQQQHQQQQQQQQQLFHSFNSQLDLGGDSEQQLNRHKKLQRQAPQPPHPFQLAVPTYSAPLQQQQQQQGNNNYHQYLTRTPSAPLADQHHGAKLSVSLSMPAHNMAHLSASDSRINEELHTAQASRDEQRRLLRYHLNNLFPQHQVHAVLQLYPDETDAKKICQAILNLFPHN